MKIKNISVNGFRCLSDFTVRFEDDLTVIVGENDSGKTSLVDCLKVITQGSNVEIDDFNHNSETIEISVDVNDFVFERKYVKDGDRVDVGTLKARPKKHYLENAFKFLIDDGLDLSDNGVIEEIKKLAKIFGLTVRANSNVSNLQQAILQKIDNTEDGVVIENANFPPFNNIQLDGKQFENVSGFFKEVFLKEKQGEIWQESIDGETTIEEFVRDRIDSYSINIEKDIKDKGILERMQLFIRDLTEVKIEPIYQKRDLNIDAKVKFMENGNEISIEKKGDGTKRRITMALLEYKKEQSMLEHDSSTIYLLDEPDTHLHVKAQIEFLETVKKFSNNGSQVILTTHSPFIINSVQPKQVRLLENNNNNSKIRYLKHDVEASDRVLQAVGIENTYLFFARHLIIVEGETEEKFLHAYFLNRLGTTPSSSLVKIINCKGIPNIPGFSTAILEIHNSNNIHLLYDNDASPELKELIAQLNLPNERNYIVGEKEFEDAFTDRALFDAWKSYLEDCGKRIPENWTIESIKTTRQECIGPKGKFSKSIRSLNSGGKKMSKPIFGSALGTYLEKEQIPERLVELINAVKKAEIN